MMSTFLQTIWAAWKQSLDLVLPKHLKIKHEQSPKPKKKRKGKQNLIQIGTLRMASKNQ